MPQPDVFDLMRRSLETLAAEAPQAEAALRRAIGPLRTTLATEGHARLFHLTPAGFALDETAEAADVEIGFDRALVLDLAEGRLTLEDALIADRLHAKGEVAAITRLHEALMIYLEGLLRAPGAAVLYDAYRQI
jgi:hypothetical protein